MEIPCQKQVNELQISPLSSNQGYQEMRLFSVLFALLCATSAQASVTKIYDADMRFTVTSRGFWDLGVVSAESGFNDRARNDVLDNLTSAELGASEWLPGPGEIWETRLQVFRNDLTGHYVLSCSNYSKFFCFQYVELEFTSVTLSNSVLTYYSNHIGGASIKIATGGQGYFGDDAGYFGTTANGQYGWQASSGIIVDYQVEALSVRPVPLPASALMLLAGLGGLALRRLQRAL